MNEKIKIENLHKSFGPKTVLDGVDLSVYGGEILCVIGKSGTGKSVILKNLVGILTPDSGTIAVDVSGEEKKSLTVEDLLKLFEKARGGDEEIPDMMILG